MLKFLPPPSGCVQLPGSYPPSQSPQLPPIFNLKISVFIPFNPGRPFSYLLSFRSHKAIFAVLGFLKTDIGGSSAGGRVCLCVHNFLSFFSSVPVSYPIPSSLFVRFGEAPRKALPHLGPWPFGLLLLLSVSRLQTRHNIKALLQTFKRPLLIGELDKLLEWIKSKKRAFMTVLYLPHRSELLWILWRSRLVSKRSGTGGKQSFKNASTPLNHYVSLGLVCTIFPTWSYPKMTGEPK